MQADIICVGNELLSGLIENSNSGYLSRKLWALGVSVRMVSVVADDYGAIRDSLRTALEKSDVVIITGGLGPTDDDLTREAVAACLDLSLAEDSEWLARLKRYFDRRGFEMTDNNRKQAMKIETAMLLQNNCGTAPGSAINYQGKMIFMLPGPPNEMQSMFDDSVMPYLEEEVGDNIAMARTLKVIGIGESMLEDKIKNIAGWDCPTISYIAKGFEVFLQLKANGSRASASAALNRAEEQLREALGEAIYGRDDETLAGNVARTLLEKKKTLALAESCSGGHLSDKITDIPGSSGFYKGAMVAYSITAKQNLPGITRELIDREGVVSEAVAAAMAVGAKKMFETDIGIGITGVAGPQSDEAENPLGLVYSAIALDDRVECKKLTLMGGRRAVKERSAQLTLDFLRRCLL